MSRPLLLLLALSLAGAPAFAQELESATTCSTPDTIVVRGNRRVSDATIRGDAGLTAGQPLNYRVVQRAIHDIFATGQFDDVRVDCETVGARAALAIVVDERPILGSVSVEGVDRVAGKSVRDQVELVAGRPADPNLVARAISKIDSVYEKSGFYLARVSPESTVVNDTLKLVFRIDEGRRLAVSGVRVTGNRLLGDKTIVGAMKTRPEGFLWLRRGEFDEDEYVGDLGERIPALYGRLGFIDFQILRDTLVVDRERGKALVDLRVAEGPRYRIGRFETIGNRRFSSEEIRRFYPFDDQGPTLAERVTGLIPFRDKGAPAGVFDQGEWEEATNRVRTAYSNEGYIYASVRPVVERQVVPGDTTPTVNLRWEIDERNPAIVHRIEIAGNDYTSDACIRDQLIILPGDVFNQDRLIRSYQNISNLGFFESPLPTPDTRPANEHGDVDVVFRVKEKRTGNINFGASMGQGTGVGGFIGLDQPNLFGQCKRGSLQWQFGAYINDFNMSYTDPSLRGTRNSGTVNAYHTQTRYQFSDFGRITRTGAQFQLGLPVPRSPFSRVFVSYGAEFAKYGTGGFLGDASQGFDCRPCFRSTLGITAQRDTRIDMPFPTAGGYQNIASSFSGGPLGGRAQFQRYTTEIFSFAPLGQVGGTKPGSQPIKFVLGLKARGGALFGDPQAFFFTQQFTVGGTQFGEALRGYESFSITPTGYRPNTNEFTTRRDAFGSAFFTATAEVGVRFNQMLYVNTFYDAGNVYRKPQDFDPTRLFRSAGLGVSLVTPLGPLGLDWGYGFDRLDEAGRPAPGWKVHFKLGQIF